MYLLNISLHKAELKDAMVIHTMQQEAFMPLLQKYKDYETNPANEAIEKIISRIEQPASNYYIIKSFDINVGGIRIVKRDNKSCSISPVFILPKYQGKGIAQEVFKRIEQLYFDVKGWELVTILQEKGNCYLYEKIGYRKTGDFKSINDELTLVTYRKMMQT